MKAFLFSTCEDISRLLPPPTWEPAWQSAAASECANVERGPAGPWGEDPVRSVYTAGALYLDAIRRCLTALADALRPEATPYVLEAIARSAMEAGAVLWWLLEPCIGARRRVIRFWLIRASGASHLDSSVKRLDPQAPLGFYGETPDMVRAATAGLGLTLKETPNKRSWVCETETLPSYTARAREFESAVKMSAAYAIYSGAAHAEWHAVVAGWRHRSLPTQGSVLVSRPDLVAVGAAVLASAGFAIVPTERALNLLGRTARIAELGYHGRRAEDMIHRLKLPEQWSMWRR